MMLCEFKRALEEEKYRIHLMISFNEVSTRIYETKDLLSYIEEVLDENN